MDMIVKLGENEKDDDHYDGIFVVRKRIYIHVRPYVKHVQHT